MGVVSADDNEELSSCPSPPASDGIIVLYRYIINEKNVNLPAMGCINVT